MDIKGTASVLVIKNPQMFYEDLKVNIPIAVNSSFELTSSNFAREFHSDYPFIGKYVNYNKYNYTKNFFDHSCNISSLFYKHSDYKSQSEYRIAINNIRFKQEYNIYNYDFRINQLSVSLPNLHSYSKWVSCDEFESLRLMLYDEDNFYMGTQKKKLKGQF